MPTKQELLNIANREQALTGPRPAIGTLGDLLPALVWHLKWDAAFARVVYSRAIELRLTLGRGLEMVFRLHIDLGDADGKPVLRFGGKEYRNPGQKYDLFDDVYRAIREAITVGTDGKAVEVG